MKTTESIDKEIASHLAEIEQLRTKNTLKEKFHKGVLKKIEALKTAKRYLETKPSETFLKSEYSRITEFIQSKQSQFERWKKDAAPKNVDPKKFPAMFAKEVGITLAKKQLKTVKYLID